MTAPMKAHENTSPPEPMPSDRAYMIPLPNAMTAGFSSPDQS